MTCYKQGRYGRIDVAFGNFLTHHVQYFQCSNSAGNAFVVMSKIESALFCWTSIHTERGGRVEEGSTVFRSGYVGGLR